MLKKFSVTNFKNFKSKAVFELGCQANYEFNSEVINNGINSHSKTISEGNILNNIAMYIMFLISGLLIVGFIVYRNRKRKETLNHERSI